MHADPPRPAPAADLARRVRQAPLGPALVGSLAVALAVWAQRSLDLAPTIWFDALVLFALAILAWGWSHHHLPSKPAHDLLPIRPGPGLGERRWQALAIGLALVALTVLVWPALTGPTGGGLGILAYPAAGDGRGNLTPLGGLAWLVGLALFVWALAEEPAPPWWSRPGQVRRGWAVRIGSVALVVAGITVVAAWLRLYDLGGFPREMTSDHTEKLLDIRALLDGWRPVFLPGNAGREPLQFYWTALLVRLGLTWGFSTLKLGMAVVSLATVPLVYLAGREVAGRATGLVAAVVLALAPWHLQITRTALRLPFAPLFTALVLYLLLRALRTGRRNDFLALGLATGLGVYGYTGFRPMLVVAPLIVLLRLAHDAWRARGSARPALPAPVVAHLAAAAGLTLVLATPLLRYAVDRPDAFWYRTRTRMTGVEVALPNPAPVQLAINTRNALLLANRTNDSAWFNSPPGRPALEMVGGALFVLGLVTALLRAGNGDWRAGGLLLGFPLMLLSSILALAFPQENPSLARAAGALPVVAILAALPFPILARWWARAPRRAGRIVVALLGAWLVATMARGTWERVFVEFRAAYDGATHPTREAAAMMQGFVRLGGDLDHVYLVGWPHAWDYRALGIFVGQPEWNNVLFGTAPDFANAVEDAVLHVDDPAPKLYFVGGAEALVRANLAHLAGLYPSALMARHRGHVEGKDFWTVYVPPARAGASDG